MRNLSGKNMLLSRDVPPLSQQQLELFSLESIQAIQVGSFNPSKAISKLRSIIGKKVLAVDLGGTSIVASQYINETEGLRISNEPLADYSQLGSGYLKLLETIAKKAVAEDLMVGLSIAGPLNGTILKDNPNSPLFAKDLANHYNSDFAQLFNKFTIDNDAIAGLKAGAIAANKQFPDIDNVLYVINGSGFGGALLQKDKIFQMEPGHVSVVPVLNPLGQTTPCGQYGRQDVCLERIVGGKAGIEIMYKKVTNINKTGEQISHAYQDGDELALDLYDLSAIGAAHIVKAIGDLFNLFDKSQKTVLVCHGGVFNVPGYPERFEQIVKKYIHHTFPIIYTKDLSLNLCLDGAAIAALTAQ